MYQFWLFWTPSHGVFFTKRFSCSFGSDFQVLFRLVFDSFRVNIWKVKHYHARNPPKRNTFATFDETPCNVNRLESKKKNMPGVCWCLVVEPLLSSISRCKSASRFHPSNASDIQQAMVPGTYWWRSIPHWPAHCQEHCPTGCCQTWVNRKQADGWLGFLLVFWFLGIMHCGCS